MTGFADGMVSGPFSVNAQTVGVASGWRPPLAEASCATEDASACCYDPFEHVGMLPVVVTEGELVEVQREVIFRHVMERPHDTALNERPETINVVGVDLAPHVFASTVTDGLMRQDSLQGLIAHVFVRGDQIHALRDGVIDEFPQRGAIGTLDNLRDDIPLPSNRTDHGDLAFRPTTAPALAPMAVLVFAPDVGFINLHGTHELRELPVLHGSADAVAHVPRRPVGACADGALDLHGAHTLLALAHEVDHLEPGGERVVGVLEDRPDQGREAVALLATLLALPRPGTSELMNLRVLTARAGHTIGPAQANQVAFAGVLGGEPRIELCECHHG